MTQVDTRKQIIFKIIGLVFHLRFTTYQCHRSVSQKWKSRISVCHNLLVTEKQPQLTQIMECQYYSSIQKLFGVTAFVLRFVNNLKSRIRLLLRYFAGEISTAKSLWIQEAWSYLVEDLNFEVWKRQLELFHDPNGIWRCGDVVEGFQMRTSPIQRKHPVLLPWYHSLHWS